MSTKNNWEERLQSIIDDIEMEFAALGNPKNFLDFYYAWRDKRISFFGGGKMECYICTRDIKNEKALEYKRVESPTQPDICYNFHTSCLDALVIKNHIMGVYKNGKRKNYRY